MKVLDFEPKKTTAQFLDNYKKHDIALRKVTTYFQQRRFTVIHYGLDKRNERIWGDDRPDLLIWRNGYWLAFIDCKGHSEDTWFINERAYNTYLDYSRLYQIPIVCIWVNLTTGSMQYAEIPFDKPIHDYMPHDRNNVVKTQDVSPIHKLIKRLRLTLFEGIGDEPKGECTHLSLSRLQIH